MKKIINSFLFTLLGIASYAQNAAIPVEAESGTLGADFNTVTEDDIIYITPATDFNNAAYPGIDDKISTYSVSFEAAGVYDLYARVRVGPNNANDDSFYVGNGFGVKTADVMEDWIRINGAGGTGEANLEAYVTEDGVGGTEIWKWINITECSCTEGVLDLTVADGGLTQTFQIGSREDGFDIDMLAFAHADRFYTGIDLMTGGTGTDEVNSDKTAPIATGQTKFLGSAHSNAQSARFDWHWNQVTPENAGKWGSVEGTRDQYNWGGLDAAYNLARENDFIYKHHVLFWGAQQPTWLPALSAEEQLAEIHEWLDTLARRYPDLEMLEVVNEPLHDPPAEVGANVGTADYGGYMDALGGSGTTGWDWILEGFRLARQYFPNAQLMLNDYSILNSISNRNEYIEIIDLLKAEQLIDMIGVQGHAFSINNMNATGMINALNQLGETDLPVYVTELDIDGPGPNGDRIQLERYQELFPAMWEHDALQGITMWGFNPGHWREDEGATLVRPDGTMKPAFIWLRGYVEGTFVETSQINVTAATNNIDVGGTLEMIAVVAPEDTSIPQVVWSVENLTGSATIDEDGLLTGTTGGQVEVTAEAIDGSGVHGSMMVTINSPLSLDSKNSGLSVYPNPLNKSQLTLAATTVIDRVVLINMEGKTILDHPGNGQTVLKMDTALNSGMYFVRAYHQGGVHIEKLLVR